MNGITKETYEKMPVDDKLNVLFDLHKDTQKCACETQENLVRLENKVDRKKRLDTTVAAGMGLIGGAAVWVVKWVGGIK
jgi:hypothetical protein